MASFDFPREGAAPFGPEPVSEARDAHFEAALLPTQYRSLARLGPYHRRISDRRADVTIWLAALLIVASFFVVGTLREAFRMFAGSSPSASSLTSTPGRTSRQGKPTRDSSNLLRRPLGVPTR